MRKDRSYALAVVLGITWMVNIVCLAFHIFNTLSTYAIIALTGTILTGMVPSIARGLNDCSKGAGFPIAIGSLLHIAVGLVGAIFVGLTVGESDYNDLTLAAAASNIVSNGVAHQLFLDDDRQVKIIEDDDKSYIYLAKLSVCTSGIILSFIGVYTNANYWSSVIHIVAFTIYEILLIAYQCYDIFITRFYLGSAMAVISSYAIAENGSEFDIGIFACVMLLLVMGHWAPTLDDRPETYRNDRIN